MQDRGPAESQGPARVKSVKPAIQSTKPTHLYDARGGACGHDLVRLQPSTEVRRLENVVEYCDQVADELLLPQVIVRLCGGVVLYILCASSARRVQHDIIDINKSKRSWCFVRIKRETHTNMIS